MSNLAQWLAEREEKDRVLYQQYGVPLEPEHKGEYLAISDDGRTILSRNDVEVLQQAIAKFGSGTFAFVRVGHRTFGQWLNIRR